MNAPRAAAPDLARLRAAHERVASDLLAERGPDGHWIGELSSSALSTATAAFALDSLDRATASRPARRDLVLAGLDWLARNRNPDGGWGDTDRSRSNISTTALVWSAFSIEAGREERFAPVVRDAAGWIERAAGGIDPATLSRAIVARYGKDHTFSVPILTMCALAGRLGADDAAWRLVPALPFEAAAFPHRWLKHLRLPVVSYALPALIAIGQLIHSRRPPMQPVRALRDAARERTLRVLGEIQPASGGFLEATPLTAFVAMSLAGAGRANDPVATRGGAFLEGQARPDGSWPIDTNLSTWTTTLSINALAESPGGLGAALSRDEIANLRERLLAWQYREEHPFTHAAPGGWAWTDLSGGVPDADDTPGALLALHNVSRPEFASPAERREAIRAAEAGVGWLVDLGNDDGGIPTFCRGWGALPFDRSGADLTAHTLRAFAAWLPDLPPPAARRAERTAARCVRYLEGVARADGSWLPLWFGNEAARDEANPVYGTARVAMGLAPRVEFSSRAEALATRGAEFLCAAANPDGGWGGERGVASSVEETAVALDALVRMEEARARSFAARPALLWSERRGRERDGDWEAAIARGANRLAEAILAGEHERATPIGFYFANLWYHERLYPHAFATSALGRARRFFEDPGARI